MPHIRRMIITSCAFLALAVLLSALTTPYFRQAERESAIQTAVTASQPA